MNRSKKYMMAAALATLSCGAMAQGLNTGYFIDGYTFRHNLNPAYGNDQNYVSIPALGNIQVRTQGNFGFLSSTRINGKYSWTDARLSANVAPLSWLDGGMSFSVNSFTASMGWVINAHPKGFNFFIGMDHILGKTSKEFIPLSSNASLNLGMNVTF